MGEKAILFDSTKCMACRGCQVACKQWWELPAVITTNRGTYENPPDLSAETWNRIRFREIGHNGTVRWLFTRQACMHCTNAACVWVCPTYARGYDELGYVFIDPERCIGCARCVEHCPFKVPKMGTDQVTPRIAVEVAPSRTIAYKCAFCKDRIKDGLTPACAKTCPSGALQFGERADLVEQGRARVNALKAIYPKAYLYGEHELRGLHVLYVLTDEPSVHDLPEKPQLGIYPEFAAYTFPDWYEKAIATGRFPVFPSGARPDWYLQPQLKPAATAEPAWPALPPGPFQTGAGWGVVGLLWGWLGLGVVGALSWVIGRRIAQAEERTGEQS